MRCVIALFVALSAASAWAAEKPRVFITDSKSWEISGGVGGTSDAFGGSTKGGARPQTAEIIKTFGERCPDVIVNNRQEIADYIVLLDHEGGKGLILRDNKVAVFKRSGDALFSHSTRSLGNSVKEACDAVVKDWSARGSQREPDPVGPSAGSRTASPGGAEVEINSNQPGADIEIDGSFVGNTPSTIKLTPVAHTLTVKKAGFKPWERKMNVSGGHINVSATLEPQ
jgi:hypothetical protein